MRAGSSIERAPLPTALERPEPGRVLVFAPHPDDEVLGCGGTLALHREQGDAVRVVVAFDGAGAEPGESAARAELTRRRQGEARAAAARLGGYELCFWGEPEGHQPGDEDFDRALRRARDEIAGFRPETVYAPWSGEHHLDHHVLARVVQAALEGIPPAGAHRVPRARAYEVWTPLVAEVVVNTTSAAQAKRLALAEFKSQNEHTALVEASFGLASQRALYLPKGALHGEAFRNLRPADGAGSVA